MNKSEPASRASLSALTLRLLVIAFASAGPVLAVAPLGMAPLLIVIVALAFAAERYSSGVWSLPSRTPAALFLILLIWSALSLTWALNPASGARKLLDLALTGGILQGLLALAPRVSTAQRRHLALALLVGMAIGLSLLAVETLFDFPLYRAVMGNSDPRLVDLVESKRSVDALPLLVWPACLALAVLGRAWLGALFAGLFAIACFKLTASSATLGMLVSLVVFAASFISVKWVRRALSLATVLGFVLIVPLAIFAYEHGGTTSHWLKHSAQHRVEIWHFAAQRTLEQPLFGYGFNASRFVPNGDAISQFLPPGQSLIPLHPHDGFLQIWLELGAVGATITGALLLTGLRAIGKLPTASMRFALAGYAAGMIVASLAFGIWQSWWMATLAFSAGAYKVIGTDHD